MSGVQAQAAITVSLQTNRSVLEAEGGWGGQSDIFSPGVTVTGALVVTESDTAAHSFQKAYYAVVSFSYLGLLSVKMSSPFASSSSSSSSVPRLSGASVF